jgi:hypothetical protein
MCGASDGVVERADGGDERKAERRRAQQKFLCQRR